MNKQSFKRSFLLPVVLAIGSGLFSCKKSNVTTYHELQFPAPEHFPEPVYRFEGNTLKWFRFQLGRQLFYDEILSLDSTVSCASCHAQTHAFAGHNTPLSPGVNGQLGTRNSPGLANLAWSTSFMWDGGISHIEILPIAPITNPVEMKESLAHVVSKLQASPRYKSMFKQAYGSESVTSQKMLQALAQFMAMIVSDGSKYDRFRRGEAAFTASEQSGHSLFQQHCSQCHTEPLFTDYSFRNNGIDAVFTDNGRAIITQADADKGKFKVPSLRNIELTYPYMHDGRFFTLPQVLDHYHSGIQQSATLDPFLSSGISLSAQEKTDIIAFLKTLTDHTLLSNALLNEPKN